VSPINNSISYLVPSAPQRRDLAPAQKSFQLQDQPRQQEQRQSLPTVMGESLRERLHVRAVILSRESNTAGLTTRGREAVATYKSLETRDEKDYLSDLLGVDEYV
jgi:hypothetical protein